MNLLRDVLRRWDWSSVSPGDEPTDGLSSSTRRLGTGTGATAASSMYARRALRGGCVRIRDLLHHACASQEARKRRTMIAPVSPSIVRPSLVAGAPGRSCIESECMQQQRPLPRKRSFGHGAPFIPLGEASQRLRLAGVGAFLRSRRQTVDSLVIRWGADEVPVQPEPRRAASCDVPPATARSYRHRRTPPRARQTNRNVYR